MKWRFLLIAGLLIPRAALPSEEGARVSAAFLSKGEGAGASVAAGAFGLIDPAAEALFWNPAALGGIEKGHASFSRTALPGEVSQDSALLALPGSRGRAWAVGARRLSWGSIERLDGDGNVVGSLIPSDLAFSAGAAFPLGGTGVVGGLAVSAIRSTLDGSAQTVAVDAGILTSGFHGGRGSLSAALVNLGGRLRFDAEASPLPQALRAGSAWRFSRRWRMVAGLIVPRRGAPRSGAGFEFRFPVGVGGSAFERLGYSRNSDRDSGEISAALGWGRRDFSVEYAYRSPADGWAVHVVSVGLRFRSRSDARRVNRIVKEAEELKTRGLFLEAALRFNDALDLDPGDPAARRGLRDSLRASGLGESPQ